MAWASLHRAALVGQFYRLVAVAGNPAVKVATHEAGVPRGAETGHRGST